MHHGALRALEFDHIVEAVRSFALTPLGAARLAELRPHVDRGRVETAQAETSETAKYLEANPLFPLHAPAGLELALSALAVEGRPLEPLQLIALAEFLGSVENARNAIRRAARGPFPILRGIADNGRSFDAEIADVRSKIEVSGEVLDSASPELRNIRDRLRKQRNRLRTTLESYLRGKDTAKYLQEQIVTDRSGRFVLIVKAEHRAAIPGIVHGASVSGASLFLEPLSTVEINNEVVALEEQEAEEVRRILLALSNTFRSRAADLHRTITTATDLDVLQARARFSELVGGVQPGLSEDASLEFRSARHPLLIGAVLARLPRDKHQADAEINVQSEPVPVDILIIDPDRVLVMTGPNTGGKTVALKTAGLLSLMAQAGLHIPAASGSRLPVFRSVFADIGDEQSIVASLSTFSSHITNIAHMDRALSLPGLILLDELGAGTDPVEGGALGMALLEHFRRRGALMIATTHYDMLKSYASTTDGVVSAAFGFNPETFAPTYRLLYGSPGRSLALEIAARLGLPRTVIDEARHYRSSREAQLADHLARVEREISALDHDRRLAVAERAALDDRESRVRGREEQLRQREEAVRHRAQEEVDQRLREARREIDKVIEDLKRQTAALAAEAVRRTSAQEPPLSTGDTGLARANARSALETVADRAREWGGPGSSANAGGASPPSAQTASAEPPEQREAALAVGDRVMIGRFGLEGIVRVVHDHDAEVDVRGKRMRVPLAELRAVAGAATNQQAHVRVSLQPRETVPTDLNIIGCSVDEALDRVEKFLDEAMLAEQRSVRFIHGYGTGQLRRAIADFLHHHPLVARFAAASPEQGGGGVTVAELKD